MYMKFAGDFLPSQKIARNDKKSLFSRGGLQCELTWHRGTKFEHEENDKKKLTEEADQVEKTEKN